MNKSVLCLLILIIGLVLGMGAACASENLDTPASVGESPMEVENGGFCLLWAMLKRNVNLIMRRIFK